MDLNEVFSELNKFREDRDWKKFHNPKDLAISFLSCEQGEGKGYKV